MASIIKFQVGRTYWTTSACDHECVFSFKVVRRTAKTVWVEYHGRVTARRITIDDYYQAESIMPMGTYSMAPVLTAMDCDELKAEKAKGRRVEPDALAPGQKGTTSGYPATVLSECCPGMYEVRVPGGVTCISARDFVPDVEQDEASTMPQLEQGKPITDEAREYILERCAYVALMVSEPSGVMQ